MSWSTWETTGHQGEYTSDSGDGLLRATMLVDTGPNFKLMSIRLASDGAVFTDPTSIDIATLSAASGNTSHISIINNNAFKGCTGLSDINIPAGVTRINSSAFQGCTGLTSIVLPDTITTIGDSAFKGTNITSIVLFAAVTTIGASAFQGLALPSIVIPATVTSIGADAFNVETAIFLCPKPGVIDLSGTNVYYDPSTTGWDPGPSVTSLADAQQGELTPLSYAYVSANGPAAYYPAFTAYPVWGPWTLSDPSDPSGNTYFSISDDGSFHATITLIDLIVSSFELTLVERTPESGLYLYYTDIAGINAVSGIPNSVIESIGEGAFSNIHGMVGVNIPFGVTTIGNTAFAGNNLLSSIVLPAGLTSIGDYAFDGCSGLTSVTLPDGLTTIGFSAFSGCESLTSIVIPPGVTTIPGNTFNQCINLSSVVLPTSITSIGSFAFNTCSLTSIVLPDGLTTIGAGSFYSCHSLTSIVIPAGVTSIEDEVFNDCISLESVVLPAGLTSIGAGSFYNCASLTSISLPAGLMTISNIAFANTILSSIVIPAGATVAQNVFAESNVIGIFLCPYANVDNGSGFHGISQVYFDPDQADWVGITDAISLVDVTGGSLTTYAPQYIVAGGPPKYYFNAFDIKVPTWVGSWSDLGLGIFTLTSTDAALVATMTYAGKTDFELTRVRSTDTGTPAFTSPVYIDIIAINAASGISKSQITSIGASDDFGAGGFFNCTGLRAINIPDGITKIGSKAFYNCPYLTSITLPGTVDTIEASAFAGCTGLTSIVLPSAVTTLNFEIFNACHSLQSVTASGVTSIGQYVFADCFSLVGFTLPPTLTDISEGLFNNCSSLTTIQLPASLTSIGANGFKGCSSLTSINIPPSVTSIGPFAFLTCSNLESIILPPNLTVISDALLNGCPKLPTVIIPASVTSINNNAFTGCSGLRSVVIPAGDIFVAPSAFDNCPTLQAAVFLGSWADVSGVSLPNIYYDPNQPGWADVSGPISLADISDNTLELLKAQYLAAHGPSEFYPKFGIAKPTWLGWDTTASPIITNTSTDGLVATIDVSGLGFVLKSIRDAVTGYPFTKATYIDIYDLVTSPILSSALKTLSDIPTIEGFIADSAFQACTGLVAIAIPPTFYVPYVNIVITTIGQYAFYGCTNMIGIVVPNSVYSVETATFAGCGAATAVFLCPLSAIAEAKFGGLENYNIYYDASAVPLMLALDPILDTWPDGSISLADAPPNALSFLADEYLIANGPTTYYGAFGIVNVCYAKGTKILTKRGYIAIEELTADDMVVTNGEIAGSRVKPKLVAKRIKWMGHYTAHGLNDDSRPICIKADAFGPRKPFEDLYVSPGHSIVTRDGLINAGELINGTTIDRAYNYTEVTYYHIELETHSTIIANGVAAESYKEANNRRILRRAPAFNA